MNYSETDKFNDRVFGTGWLGIGLLLLWMGFYVIKNLPMQHFGDIAYFISLFFVLLGSHQIRKGRELKAKMWIINLLSNLFYLISFVLYVGCLIWFKWNFERLVETQADFSYLLYVIITAFVCLSIGILLNFFPIKAFNYLKTLKQQKFKPKTK